MSEIKRGPAAAFAGAMIVLAVLAGCASAPPHAPASQGETPEHAAHHHGESSATPEAVAPGQPAKTLSPDPLDAPAPTSVADAQRSEQMAGGHGGHGAHGVARYRHVDAGRGPGAHEGSEKQTPGAEPHQHEGEHSHESHGAAEGGEAAVYACPMHPEVTSNAPGKCSKCGMALVERRKE